MKTAILTILALIFSANSVFASSIWFSQREPKKDKNGDYNLLVQFQVGEGTRIWEADGEFLTEVFITSALYNKEKELVVFAVNHRPQMASKHYGYLYKVIYCYNLKTNQYTMVRQLKCDLTKNPPTAEM